MHGLIRPPNKNLNCVLRDERTDCDKFLIYLQVGKLKPTLSHGGIVLGTIIIIIIIMNSITIFVKGGGACASADACHHRCEGNQAPLCTTDTRWVSLILVMPMVGVIATQLTPITGGMTVLRLLLYCSVNIYDCFVATHHLLLIATRLFPENL